MPYDEGHAQILRDLLAHTNGITEKKMFGGLCFLQNGNMLCGAHSDGGMFRVGKENEEAALTLNGVAPLSFTGRKMGGLVDISESTLEDEDALLSLLRLADTFVGEMPSK